MAEKAVNVVPANFISLKKPDKEEENSTSSPDDDKESTLEIVHQALASDTSRPPVEDLFPSIFALRRILFSIITLLFDVGSDIVLAVNYFNKSANTFALLTLFFILYPAIWIGFYNKSMLKDGDFFRCSSRFLAVLYVVYSMFQLEVAHRYAKTYRVGLECRKACKECQGIEEAIRLSIIFQEEMKTTTFMRYMEAVMEAAPQAALQIFVAIVSLRENIEISYLQIFSIVTSLISIALALAMEYQMNLKESNKETILCIIWHFCITSSRIVLFALFASVWNFYFVAMAYIILSTSRICTWSWWAGEEKVNWIWRIAHYFLFLSWFHLFTFIFVREDWRRTQPRRAFVFYLIIFIENGILLALWIVASDRTAYPETISFKIARPFVEFALGTLVIVLIHEDVRYRK